MSESTMEIDETGDKVWRNSKDVVHRTNGPAVECVNGTKKWCVDGRLHRLDGPAIEFFDGTKAWFLGGEWLGYNDQGFWALWDSLSKKGRVNPTLLSYLPEKF
jgi:hypothetical protein